MRGQRKERGDKFRKIGREGKKENFTHEKPMPRRETKGGRR